MTWTYRVESAARGAKVTYLKRQGKPAEVFIDQGERHSGNIVVTGRSYETLAYFTPKDGDTSEEAFKRVCEALGFDP